MRTIPRHFYCPLNRTVMHDPVLAPDGATYERSTIESHLRHCHRSPKTFEPMSIFGLRANGELKEEMDNFFLTNPDLKPHDYRLGHGDAMTDTTDTASVAGHRARELAELAKEAARASRRRREEKPAALAPAVVAPAVKTPAATPAPSSSFSIMIPKPGLIGYDGGGRAMFGPYFMFS